MDVMLIFDVVIAIFGVYMIGAALKMKKTGKISSAVITAEEIARCRKTKEFIAFIYWKEAVFGALIIAVGVLGIINDKVVSLGAFNVVELLIFLAAFLCSSPSCARQGNSFYKRFSESSDGIHRNVTLRRYDVKNREVSAL